jgi:F0F1-type ATP synthase assembly protein I
VVTKPVRALEAAEDGVVAAFELVLTPALFALFGYLIDKWLGTSPLFLASMGGLVAVYEIWKLWYTYTQKMRSYEKSLPDAKGSNE